MWKKKQSAQERTLEIINMTTKIKRDEDKIKEISQEINFKRDRKSSLG